jgi:hypothetical protein
MIFLDGSQGLGKNGLKDKEVGENGGKENDKIADACYD